MIMLLITVKKACPSKSDYVEQTNVEQTFIPVLKALLLLYVSANQHTQ